MILKNQFLKGIVPLLSACFFLFPHSISATDKADLKIIRIDILPGNPLVNGGEAMIRMTVKNTGGQRPSKKSSLNAGLWSVNQNGTRINGTRIPMLFSSYSLNIPKLEPNEQIRLIGRHTFQHAGKHKVEAWINTEGFAAGEEVSGNNFTEKMFSVKASLSDLVVCFKKNNKVSAHRKSTFPVTIRNIGNETSTPCDLRFWIEKKGIKHYTIPALAPGKAHSIQRKVYFASKRTSRVSLSIDSKKQVREMNENNNIIQGTICTEKYCLTPANSPTKCSNE